MRVVVVKAHWQGEEESSALLLLSDSELRDFGQEVSSLIGQPVVDFESVRNLIADWAITARMRNHPDYQRNAGIYREAVESGEIYAGLD